VARSRLTGGVWTARLFAMLCGLDAVVSLFGFGGPRLDAFVGFGISAAVFGFASRRLDRGSRTDAIILFAVFLVLALGSVAARDESIVSMVVMTVGVVALGNAVLGSFELARVMRESENVPPPPPRET
jgi:hypothetical protein